MELNVQSFTSCVQRPNLELINLTVTGKNLCRKEAEIILNECGASSELLDALKKQTAMIRKAQDVLSEYMTPDGSDDADECINRILAILDCKEEYSINALARAAIAKAEGEMIAQEGDILLPCPFCGTSDELTTDRTQKFARVYCDNCGVFGPIGDRDSGAKEWNTRFGPSGVTLAEAPAAVCSGEEQ